MQNMENIIFPLQKYKGQPMEVVLQDRKYCDWLTAQDWFRNKYEPIYKIIIYHFGQPSETPEHNALQNRFLNDNYCFTVGKLCNWQLMNKKHCIYNLLKEVRIAKDLPERNEYEINKRFEKLDELKEMIDIIESIDEVDGIAVVDGEPFFEMGKSVEQDGWDVIIKTDDTFCRKEECVA
jgi:hypothetical protein